jgi:hypothetical protein
MNRDIALCKRMKIGNVAWSSYRIRGICTAIGSLLELSFSLCQILVDPTFVHHHNFVRYSILGDWVLVQAIARYARPVPTLETLQVRSLNCTIPANIRNDASTPMGLASTREAAYSP